MEGVREGARRAGARWAPSWCAGLGLRRAGSAGQACGRACWGVTGLRPGQDTRGEQGVKHFMNVRCVVTFIWVSWDLDCFFTKIKTFPFIVFCFFTKFNTMIFSKISWFYWSRVDFQCRVSFKCTASDSVTRVHVFIPFPCRLSQKAEQCPLCCSAGPRLPESHGGVGPRPSSAPSVSFPATSPLWEP